MNKDEWEQVKWKQDGDVYYHREGDYEYMVRKVESGDWEQLERWIGERGWPWAVLGTADTPEAAKQIF